MEYKSEYPGVVHFEKKGHVVYLTIDNPKILNALCDETLASLDYLFDVMAQDDDIWGVIITGAGRSFIAGADLSGPKLQVERYGDVYKRRDFRKEVHDIFNKIAEFPHPTIAAINGFALGGGAELALCCDFRIASTKAKIGFPESKLGSFPDYTGPTRALRILGVTATKQMMYTGRHFPAEEAKELGFCSKVVEPDQLIPACEELMAQILDQAPLAVTYSKLMCNRGTEMSETASLEYERMLNIVLSTTEDRAEGLNAFYEKRKPEFKNR